MTLYIGHRLKRHKRKKGTVSQTDGWMNFMTASLLKLLVTAKKTYTQDYNLMRKN